MIFKKKKLNKLTVLISSLFKYMDAIATYVTAKSVGIEIFFLGF